MKVIIDRFEGDFAVCEEKDRTMLNVKRDKLPPDAKEGDILNINGDVITVDSATTAKRKNTVSKLFADLFQNKGKGKTQ
jgi:Protein of unknown function (DUF3006)